MTTNLNLMDKEGSNGKIKIDLCFVIACLFEYTIGPTAF